MHRNSRLKKSNKMQLYADIYLLLNYSTCFGRPSRLSSGVHKTVVAASGTEHTVWGTSFFKRDQIYICIQLNLVGFLQPIIAFRSIARLCTVSLLNMISSERIGWRDVSAVFNDAFSCLDLAASVREIWATNIGGMKEANIKLNLLLSGAIFFI